MADPLTADEAIGALEQAVADVLQPIVAELMRLRYAVEEGEGEIKRLTAALHAANEGR